MSEQVKPKPVRAAIYARVSTTEQHVDNQIHELQELAVARGWPVVGIFKDEGISGAKRERAGLDRMLAGAERGDFEIILIWKLDRVARSSVHLLELAEHFKKIGVAFVSKHEQIDTSTPAGQLLYGILASFAQFERDIIRTRVKAGLDAAVRRGIQLGTPRKKVDMKAVLSLDAQGWSDQRIGRALGVSKSTIRRRKLEWRADPDGFEFKSRDELDKEKALKVRREIDRLSGHEGAAKIQALMAEGKSVEEIASRVKAGESVVRTLCEMIRQGKLRENEKE